MAEDAEKKMPNNGQIWPKIAKHAKKCCQKWPIMVKNAQQWPKVAKKSLKMIETVQYLPASPCANIMHPTSVQ